ncbi:MAG: lysophospholipid acyltransferase family protein [Candidatus Binatia bacterium]
MQLVHLKDPYFLTVITLMKGVGWWSSPRLKGWVVHSLAFAAYRLSRHKRRRSEENLASAFGKELDERQKRTIVKGAFRAFWEDAFSLSLSRTEKEALQGVELSGVGHLRNALQGGSGVILWESGSFGKRSLAKHILHAHGFPLHQVHAEHHTGGFLTRRDSVSWVQYHIIRPFFERCEKQFLTEVTYLPNSDSLAFTRRLLDRLRRNAILCITGDMGLGQKLLPQSFLGHTKLFATGMISLAKISGAPILPLFCFRERDGAIRLVIEHPIGIETGVGREQSLEKSVAEYVGLLESYIRRYPEQYRGWHHIDGFSEHEVRS